MTSELGGDIHNNYLLCNLRMAKQARRVFITPEAKTVKQYDFKNLKL